MLALAQAVSLFGLRALGLCLGFLSTVIFARNTTTTTFGDFALLTSYISLLAIPTTFGLPEYLLRRFSQIKPNEIESEVHKSINSVCISFALIVGITFLSRCLGVLPEINIYALIIALATLLISSITSLKQAALRNLISTSKALWPTMLFSPAMTITCVLIVIKLVGTINLNLLMAITLLSSLLAYLISEALFYRYSKAANAKPARNSFNIIKRDQFINALPFMGLAALAILNSRIDIFILGIYRSSEEVATYAVAMKFFDAMLIPITLLNMLIATKVASYFYKNELEKLQRLITDTSRATFVSALVIGVLIIEFRNESVNLIFGNVYARSTDLITFLVVAQIINAFGASSGMILSMCHKESLSLKIGLICAIVNLIGNIILTPRLGPMGAAIATSISFVVWRVAFMTATKISLNLNPTPL